MSTPKQISILGSTGSIGQSALKVVEAGLASEEPEFEIEALVAGSNVDLLIAQARKFKPDRAVIADENLYPKLIDGLTGTDIHVGAGRKAVCEVASVPCDRVLAAISGFDGLESTLNAIEAGNSVALANKESIVCAGQLILDTAKKHEVDIIPVDSEHNALFQVLTDKDSLDKITITASGGPFFNASDEVITNATPEQALAHPIWDMGKKNSIDSATFLNKALECIEAAYLFDLAPEKIDVIIHPQSIIHGMVHYKDGTVISGMSSPDMCIPIANALAYPDRISTNFKKIDLLEIGKLEFFEIDSARFPAIELAKSALSHGKGAELVLNSADELAIEKFLQGSCNFLEIAKIVSDTLDWFIGSSSLSSQPKNLDDLTALYRTAYRKAQDIAEGYA